MLSFGGEGNASPSASYVDTGRPGFLPDNGNHTRCGDVAVFREEIDRLALILHKQGGRYDLPVVHSPINVKLLLRSMTLFS